MSTNDSPAEVVAQYLIDAGAGEAPEDADPTWPVHPTEVPDNTKDDCIGVIDTSGIKDGRYISQVVFHQGLMIYIRAKKHSVGYAKAREIQTALDNVKNTTVTLAGDDYVLKTATRMGTTIPIGRDDEGRRQWTMNLIATMDDPP